MHLLVRVDGGQEIGIGHIHRALSVVHQLERCTLFERRDILFLTGYDVLAFDIVKDQGYQVVHIGRASLGAELALHRDWVSRWHPQLVIVDVPETPNRPEAFFNALRFGDSTLVVNLSDCNSGRHSADMIVEGDVYYQEDSVSQADGYRPRYLRGPNYWVVHPAFVTTRAKSETQLQRNGVLISFGGSDPSGLSSKIVAMADSFASAHQRVTIIIGRGVNPNVSFPPDWYVGHSMSAVQMAQAMSEALIGVFSGGLTMYEAACMGLPSVIIAQNSSQERGALCFTSLGVHSYLGTAEQFDSMKAYATCAEMLGDPQAWRKRSEQGMRLIDGLGVQRIAHAIIQEIKCLKD